MPSFPPSEARILFERSLPAIERIVAIVCRRAGIRGADAEDFASTVTIALLEDDCAILRQYEGRSSMDAYLAIVIPRLLLDERERTLGRWRPSAEARRRGPAAVLVETLLGRDRRPFEQAWPIITAAHPELTREEALAFAAQLPGRSPRPRVVGVDPAELPPVPAGERADAAVVAAEERKLTKRTEDVVRATLASFAAEDQMIVQLHFGSSLSVADIARMLRVPQRPLYRRVEGLLARLRHALVQAGIDRGAIGELIAGALAPDLNFDLVRSPVENAEARR